MSRAKGNRFERDVARRLVAADGPCPTTGPLASSTGRVGHLDLGADIYTCTFAVECKARESVGSYLWSWLDHINPLGKTRLLIVKRNRHRPLVVLDLDALTKTARR